MSIDVLPAAYRPRGRLPHRVDQLARWWTSAKEADRYRLVQRIYGQAAPQKGDPTLGEFRLATLIAEAEAGEIGR